MEASKRFQQTHIATEHQLQGQGGDNVEFDITAQYVPEEPKSAMESRGGGF
jgi:hypothetical protein